MQLDIYDDNIDTIGFGKIDRMLLISGIYAKMTLAAKIVFPVIVSYADNEGISYISFDRIAKFTGLTRRAIKKAVKDIALHTGIKTHHNRTDTCRNKAYWKCESPESFIRFDREILQTGNWMFRSHTTGPLYIALRYLAFFDNEHYGECKRNISALARAAGISRDNVYSSLSELESHGLLDTPGSMLRVFYKPMDTIDRAVMNKRANSIKWFKPVSFPKGAMRKTK